MAALSPKQTVEWLKLVLSRWESKTVDPYSHEFTTRLHRELAVNYRDALKEIESEAELRAGIESWLLWEKTRAIRTREHRVIEIHQRLGAMASPWTCGSENEKSLRRHR